MTYLCVIFDPLKEVRREEYIGGMGLSNMKPPIYPLSIQFPEGGKLLSATTQVRKGGVAEDLYAIQKFENIFLRPSANLDVDATKWGFCVADVMVKMRLESGALEVVHPEKSALEKDERGIGYHMYSEANALKLVKYTNDLGLLQEWALKEERKAVVTAVNEQYKAVARHLEKLKAG